MDNFFFYPFTKKARICFNLKQKTKVQCEKFTESLKRQPKTSLVRFTFVNGRKILELGDNRFTLFVYLVNM